MAQPEEERKQDMKSDFVVGSSFQQTQEEMSNEAYRINVRMTR